MYGPLRAFVFLFFCSEIATGKYDKWCAGVENGIRSVSNLRRSRSDISHGNDNMNTLRLFGAALLLCCGTHVASAETLCAGKGTSDQVRPIPQSLYSFANTLFGEGGAEETVYRCVNDSVYLCRMCNGFCCDKLSTIRHLPSVDKFCRDSPNSDFVPLAFSGHNSAYSWRCVGKRAVVNHVEKTDARGFRADSWIPAAGAR